MPFPTLEFLGVPLVEVLNPYRAMVAVLYPQADQVTGVVRASSVVYIGARLTFAAALVAFGTWMLRKWNPGNNEPRELREEGEAEVVETLVEIDEEPAEEPVGVGSAATSAGGPRAAVAVSDRRQGDADRVGDEPARPTVADDGRARPRGCTFPGGPTAGSGRRHKPYRHPWTNPILWRELMTRAYGAKPLIIKGCYVLLFALGMGLFLQSGPGARKPAPVDAGPDSDRLDDPEPRPDQRPGSHRTDQRARHGRHSICCWCLSSPPRSSSTASSMASFTTRKEMIALPVLTAIAMFVLGIFSGENLVLFLIDFLLLCHFSAMLGLHSAITYTSSRTAVANSLATIFFLMVGILLCAFLIILNNQEFARQLLSFMIFIGAGSVALFGSLGAKNPSNAIALVAILTPFWTFYCIISLVNGDIMAAFLVSAGSLRLRHPGDAGSGRRRLRYRPGPHERDPGMR